MHGHVFQCFNESDSSNQFTRTVEALGEYISTNLNNPGDMTSLADLQRPSHYPSSRSPVSPRS